MWLNERGGAGKCGGGNLVLGGLLGLLLDKSRAWPVSEAAPEAVDKFSLEVVDSLALVKSA